MCLECKYDVDAVRFGQEQSGKCRRTEPYCHFTSASPALLSRHSNPALAINMAPEITREELDKKYTETMELAETVLHENRARQTLLDAQRERRKVERPAQQKKEDEARIRRRLQTEAHDELVEAGYRANCAAKTATDFGGLVILGDDGGELEGEVRQAVRSAWEECARYPHVGRLAKWVQGEGSEYCVACAVEENAECTRRPNMHACDACMTAKRPCLAWVGSKIHVLAGGDDTGTRYSYFGQPSSSGV